MAHLDWSQSALKIEQRPHARHETELLLPLSLTERQTLARSLRDMPQDGRSELRLVLPQGWTLYWKMRDSESRLLLAHPEADLWVGTIALDAAGWSQLLEALDRPSSGSSSELRLSQLPGVSRRSNLDVVI